MTAPPPIGGLEPEPRLARERSRLGLAIIYSGDSRAIRASLDSISRLPEPPDRVVIVEQPEVGRPIKRLETFPAADWVSYDPATPSRTAALQALSDCGLVAFIRDGCVLGARALGDIRKLFDDEPGRAAALFTSRKVLDLDDYLSSAGPTADAFDALDARGRIRSDAAPRYFTPCILVVSPNGARGGRFEIYAQRSEWAASRIFLDSLSLSGPSEYPIGSFGLIANDPDRRNSVKQGQDAVAALTRFGAAHPRYGRLAKSDIRRLMLQQTLGLLRGSRSKARYQFLKGMFVEFRRNIALQRRLTRDISQLG